MDAKQHLPDEECVLLPVAHGSGGFVHMRAVPAKQPDVSLENLVRRVKAVAIPSRQYGAQVPRAQQMQSGATDTGSRQMGD